jgi:hypothetical protein
LGEILTPPTYRDVTGPLVFLAGPIQGAPDWQGEALAILGPVPGLHVASPRRDLPGKREFTEGLYNEQVDWEHFHLERAGQDGVVLFWLAREVVHHCDRAYAQTTRFELAEAVTLHRCKGTKVVVGIEEGFTGARYLRRTLTRKAPGIPVGSSLLWTCEAAIALTLETRVP